MSTYAHTLTAEHVFARMTPAIVVDLIAHLDEANAMDGDSITTMSLALDTLFGLVGLREGIAMLAAADVTTTNPIVAAVVEEWTA